MSAKCVAPVGRDEVRAEFVDVDVMTHAITELGERFKREGKIGSEIDRAIVEELPAYLEALLYGAGERLH